ncbi:1111_t:CDS:2, partial [Paraglomus brasilianum]
MKVQFITIFVIALLALASYTQAQTCKVFLRGNFRHQTGDGMNSGCFGLDETDPTKTILVGRAVTSWTLFSGINCARGSEIASGVA